MKSFIFLITSIFIFISSLFAKDPHDNDLFGKNLICFNKSFSVDDWGIKFLENKKVEMYSLNKFIYEIYKYQRTYRTNLRDIIIMKSDSIEYVINRSRLKLGNKNCKIITGDPRILLEERVIELKLKKEEGNKI